jgi:hypothetical protein
VIKEVTTARQIFSKGDRVRQNVNCPRPSRLTRDGIFLEGTVIGFSLDGSRVNVRFDGRASVASYHFSFLDKIPAGPSSRRPNHE